ncbi:hypothetical protein ACFWBR_42465 [Streptomyces sp. NPDC060006]|uniref:hypothetical protein n=1 Tax=unclassified Streptomyces TaxID=2593676 RepID=UPI00368C56C2
MTASSPIPDGAQSPPLVYVPPPQAAAMARLYDAPTVEAIAQSAVDQAQAETRAELTQAQQDRTALDWFHGRCRAVASLCDGRPLEDLLHVGQVLAALDGTQPTTMPLTMAWDGLIAGPSGDGPGEATFVACTTSRGGKAVLALDPEERVALGGQLLATLHTAEACGTGGCGCSAEDLDASDPQVWGFICVDVAGTEGGPRWWCSPSCAAAAMTAAAAELAEVDRAEAAANVDAQAYERLHGDEDDHADDEPLYGGDLAAWVADAHDTDADRDADARAEAAEAEQAQGVPEYFDAATVPLALDQVTFTVVKDGDR